MSNVAIPPPATEGTVSMKAATVPDSNAPRPTRSRGGDQPERERLARADIPAEYRDEVLAKVPIGQHPKAHRSQGKDHRVFGNIGPIIAVIERTLRKDAG